MRCAYFARDRADISEAIKCLARGMSKPRTGHMIQLNRTRVSIAPGSVLNKLRGGEETWTLMYVGICMTLNGSSAHSIHRMKEAKGLMLCSRQPLNLRITLRKKQSGQAEAPAWHPTKACQEQVSHGQNTWQEQTQTQNQLWPYERMRAHTGGEMRKRSASRSVTGYTQKRDSHVGCRKSQNATKETQDGCK